MTAYVNPPCAVFGLCDVTCLQPFQVRVSQSGKGRKQEHVPHELQLRFLHGSLHKFLEVFQLHVAALPSWQRRVETAVRVTAERSLADCQFGHLFQAVQMLMHGLGHHMAVLAKEQFKIIIEILVKAT